VLKLIIKEIKLSLHSIFPFAYGHQYNHLMHPFVACCQAQINFASISSCLETQSQVNLLKKVHQNIRATMANLPKEFGGYIISGNPLTYSYILVSVLSFVTMLSDALCDDTSIIGFGNSPLSQNVEHLHISY